MYVDKKYSILCRSQQENRAEAKSLLTAALLLTLFFAVIPFLQITAEASVYKNSETGWQVIVDDRADLLTDEEESRLASEMEPVTAYGNAAFISCYASGSTSSYAKGLYRDLFGSDSGTIFMIDMENRNIWIQSNGAIYRTITKSYANTITDNVYKYASRGDYYGCASNAFSQICTLLEGGRIAMPMKYASNALLALAVSLLVNFYYVFFLSRRHAPSRSRLTEVYLKKFQFDNASAVYTHTTRVYDPPSKSSGGGGGHSF